MAGCSASLPAGWCADLNLEVVVGVCVTLIVCRDLKQGRVSKRLVGGSRMGRRPSCESDIGLGAHFIMRDKFGVGGEPPIYSD